ncbi:hypothetical protein A2Z22_03865 [Candidatus Woesebacteria bacterium RBG_16_34_12]|uniref:Uncharacterized protein n=1 Tax=Candidatus Woesebacteria bacterium RBG_16_34_12 TaxID=1802480 RepID=A0A1F7X7E4_9BACT|nr:MAG: hypothetical protein A2Z22_03865 [Candidatus Woesebacteria bacterium RBG_16_34_12]
MTEKDLSGSNVERNKSAEKISDLWGEMIILDANTGKAKSVYIGLDRQSRLTVSSDSKDVEAEAIRKHNQNKTRSATVDLRGKKVKRITPVLVGLAGIEVSETQSLADVGEEVVTFSYEMPLRIDDQFYDQETQEQTRPLPEILDLFKEGAQSFSEFRRTQDEKSRALLLLPDEEEGCYHVLFFNDPDRHLDSWSVVHDNLSKLADGINNIHDKAFNGVMASVEHNRDYKRTPQTIKDLYMLMVIADYYEKARKNGKWQRLLDRNKAALENYDPRSLILKPGKPAAPEKNTQRVARKTDSVIDKPTISEPGWRSFQVKYDPAAESMQLPEELDQRLAEIDQKIGNRNVKEDHTLEDAEEWLIQLRYEGVHNKTMDRESRIEYLKQIVSRLDEYRRVGLFRVSRALRDHEGKIFDANEQRRGLNKQLVYYFMEAEADVQLELLSIGFDLAEVGSGFRLIDETLVNVGNWHLSKVGYEYLKRLYDLGGKTSDLGVLRSIVSRFSNYLENGYARKAGVDHNFEGMFYNKPVWLSTIAELPYSELVDRLRDIEINRI